MKLFKKIIYSLVCVGLAVTSVGVQPVYAASMVVNSNADIIADDGFCTLREAITNANNDSALFATAGECAAGVGADTITFADDYTITLVGSQLPAMTTEITINGNGVANTIIQANAAPNTATYRVFQVSAGSTLTLDSLTVQNGRCDGSCNFNSYSGGGIYNNGGTVTITNSTLSGNSVNGVGGGIVNFGTLTITNSTLSANSASGGGGGIFNQIGTLTITNSTLSANSASGGGGVWSTVGTLTITNSTLSANSASDSGGGIFNASGTVTITNSTLSANSASDSGGGIFNYIDGTVNYSNTIIANSTGGGDCVSNSGTIGTNLNNLVEDGSCSASLNGDPNLGPLANNGGSTQTHALLAGSPAIDAGDNAICAAAPVNNTSQNGVTRPQGASCDIGAYEKLSLATPTFADVPTNGFAWAHIESIYTAGITGGCSTSPLNYCPGGQVTRAQMAVFLLKGMNGSSYSPPPATGIVFNDVPTGSFAAAFIEAFSTAGITGGCGSGNYCPSGLVTRAQMAVFLLKAKHGASYTPPPASGTMFADVPSNAFAAAWIEQLATEGITGGCGSGNYCPANPVTRAQMAVFLQKTFNLPLP